MSRAPSVRSDYVMEKAIDRLLEKALRPIEPENGVKRCEWVEPGIADETIAHLVAQELGRPVSTSTVARVRTGVYGQLRVRRPNGEGGDVNQRLDAMQKQIDALGKQLIARNRLIASAVNGLINVLGDANIQHLKIPDVTDDGDLLL